MAHREFTDALRRVWGVWAVYPTEEVSGAMGASLSEQASNGWLAFQSGAEKRRFYGPPPGWEEMSEEQLAELWAKAAPVKPPIPPA